MVSKVRPSRAGVHPLAMKNWSRLSGIVGSF
jgi:hypothetical protein